MTYPTFKCEPYSDFQRSHVVAGLAYINIILLYFILKLNNCGLQDDKQRKRKNNNIKNVYYLIILFLHVSQNC